MKTALIRALAATTLIAATLVVAAGFLVRWPVDDPGLRARIVQYVAASTGMATEATGPISLRLLPRPSIELETLTMQGADGAISLDADSLVGMLSLPQLITGRFSVAKTVLNGPTIAVDLDRLLPLLAGLAQPPPAPTDAGPGPLAFLHTGGVSFRSGLLRIKSHDPRRDMLVSDIWTTLEWPSDGSAASLSGFARWHGARGNLTVVLDQPSTLLRGGSSAAYLRLKSPKLDFSADGTLSRGVGSFATGRLSASTPDLPAFLRAVGTPSPELDGIHEARLSGDATISEATLALSNLRLSLDTMLFEGAMAINDRTGHPSLAGTLATDSIDLGPFLSALPRPFGADGRWSTVPFDTRSVAYDDIDLRISASKAHLGRLEFEDGGLSLQSGEGRMELSLGEARAYDGLFKGRLLARLDGDVTQVRAEANVSQFELKALAADFDAARQLTGTTTGHVSLEGRGNSAAEVIRSLSGRAEVGVRDGDIGPDLVAALVRAGDPASPNALALPVRKTAFDSASIGFEVSQGLARIVDGWVLRDDVRALLEGSASLPEQQADISAQVTPIGDEAPVGPGTTSLISLAGAWRDLRLTSGPSHPFPTVRLPPSATP